MPKKVLIVDDEANSRRMVRLCLKEEDLEIHEASTGDEAIEKIMAIRPDLVVLDVMMPGKLGYEVCAEVKSNPETRDTYVLFLSARDRPVSVHTGKMSGGDDYLVKPILPKTLRNTIVRALAGVCDVAPGRSA